MTSHLKASRIAARGRPLIGVTAVAFAALSLGVGVEPALFLIAVVALAAGFVWLVRHHPLCAWFVLSFVEGLTGSRSAYRRRWYRRCAAASRLHAARASRMAVEQISNYQALGDEKAGLTPARKRGAPSRRQGAGRGEAD